MHTILCNIKVNSYGITIQNQVNTTDRLFPTGNFFAGVYAQKMFPMIYITSKLSNK
jgi:hypothetical protein